MIFVVDMEEGSSGSVASSGSEVTVSGYGSFLILIVSSSSKYSPEPPVETEEWSYGFSASSESAMIGTVSLKTDSVLIFFSCEK